MPTSRLGTRLTEDVRHLPDTRPRPVRTDERPSRRAGDDRRMPTTTRTPGTPLSWPGCLGSCGIGWPPTPTSLVARRPGTSATTPGSDLAGLRADLDRFTFVLGGDDRRAAVRRRTRRAPAGGPVRLHSRSEPHGGLGRRGRQVVTVVLGTARIVQLRRMIRRRGGGDRDDPPHRLWRGLLRCHAGTRGKLHPDETQRLPSYGYVGVGRTCLREGSAG